MEKNIWLIKSVHEFNDKVVTNDVYAVTSEKKAEEDVLRMNKKAQDENRDWDYKIRYYYHKISLFD